MNIETGKRIHGYRFTELSMPQHIIDEVHELAAAEGAPDLDEDDGWPRFEWEVGAPVNTKNEATIANVVPVPDDESVGSNDTDDSDYEDEGTDDDDDDDDDDNESIESENLYGDDNSDDDDDDDDESISDDSPPAPQLKTRSDDESISDDTSSVESIDEIRSAIDAKNVIEGKRVRTERVQEPNISSFGGKKYHVNKLNIGQSQNSNK
jgi:hypothetical protein